MKFKDSKDINTSKKKKKKDKKQTKEPPFDLTEDGEKQYKFWDVQ